MRLRSPPPSHRRRRRIEDFQKQIAALLRGHGTFLSGMICSTFILCFTARRQYGCVTSIPSRIHPAGRLCPFRPPPPSHRSASLSKLRPHRGTFHFAAHRLGNDIRHALRARGRWSAILGLPFETIFGGMTAMMIVYGASKPPRRALLVQFGAARVHGAGSRFKWRRVDGPFAVARAGQLFSPLGRSSALAAPAPCRSRPTPPSSSAMGRRQAHDRHADVLHRSLLGPVLADLEFAEGAIGWRATLQMAAAAHLVLLVPLHLFGLPARGDAATLTASAHAAAKPLPILNARDRLRAFLLIASASSLNSLTSFGVSASLIELLEACRRRSGTCADTRIVARRHRHFGASGRPRRPETGPRPSPPALPPAPHVRFLPAACRLPGLTFRRAADLRAALRRGIGCRGGGPRAAALSFFTREEFATLSSNVALPQNIASALSRLSSPP